MEVDIVTESKQNTAVVVATRGNNFCYRYRRRLIGMRGRGSSRTLTLILRASESGGASLKSLIAQRLRLYIIRGKFNVYCARQVPFYLALKHLILCICHSRQVEVVQSFRTSDGNSQKPPLHIQKSPFQASKPPRSSVVPPNAHLEPTPSLLFPPISTALSKISSATTS